MSFKSVREKMNIKQGSIGIILPEVSPKYQANQLSKVLCQLHINGDLSLGELYNGILQLKNKLEREEFSEIEADYKQSLKDSND